MVVYGSKPIDSWLGSVLHPALGQEMVSSVAPELTQFWVISTAEDGVGAAYSTPEMVGALEFHCSSRWYYYPTDLGGSCSVVVHDGRRWPAGHDPTVGPTVAESPAFKAGFPSSGVQNCLVLYCRPGVSPVHPWTEFHTRLGSMAKEHVIGSLAKEQILVFCAVAVLLLCDAEVRCRLCPVCAVQVQLLVLISLTKILQSSPNDSYEAQLNHITHLKLSSPVLSRSSQVQKVQNFRITEVSKFNPSHVQIFGYFQEFVIGVL
ncbi:hypothetical protein RHGRI_004976 [Rhododendron griersonianum]|uniref:Uncharacterized protein n=1 Tax=Rhododendron griersonianum TaxID=479676 RepID=A0AAV6LDA9_9ERIC|nr:hypothetical protein RHGRI_004976 [Rhododendron griersonianum]